MDDERARRSQMVAGIFDRAARTYDSVGVAWFRPIAERLVHELAPQPGQRVLDIGTGRGAVLFPLAGAVGPQGHVTGIDLSTGMIEALREDVERERLTNVELRVMNAQAPDLEAASFDVLAASLVLFFLPAPAEALARWCTLLAPGGQLGISTFGPQDATWAAADDVFSPYLPQQMLDARASGRKGPFASDAGVEALLSGAGLVDVRTVLLDLPVTFRDADHWDEWSWSHGQRAMWESIAEDLRPQVRAEVEAVLAPATDPSGTITVQQQVRYTLARTPAR